MDKKYRNRLRTIRKTRKLEQNIVAKAIGVTSHTLRNYERWENPIPSDKLIALAQYYGCSTDYILCLEENKTE